MHIFKATIDDVGSIAPLIAKFRVELKSYKGIAAKEDIEAARAEFVEYIEGNFPIFACCESNACAGYLVCRVDSDVVWVESLFVAKEKRRQSVASSLFIEAEKYAQALGNDCLYNYVHPNNDAMIAFLNKMGYSVLNLIEIRRRYSGEELTERIRIRNNEFDY